MAGDAGTVPVVAGGPWWITLRRERGSACRVLVRKVKYSSDVRIQTAADVRDGSAASRMRAFILRIRWAILAAEGLTDADTGEPVKFTLQTEPSLGAIASEEVVDAMGNLDLSMIDAVAYKGVKPEEAEKLAAAALGELEARAPGLTEEARGNSSPPPPG